MARLSPWLWGLAGALFGVGFIAILSIGAALLLLGVILAIVVGWRYRERGMWAILIGFGLAPGAILIFDIVTAPPSCPTQGVVVASGSSSCAYIPPSYTYMAAGFLAIALLGALIPLAFRLMRAMRPNNPPHPGGAT